jgi:hypothetical protein
LPKRNLLEAARAWVAIAKPLTLAYWRIICVGPAQKDGLLDAMPLYQPCAMLIS